MKYLLLLIMVSCASQSRMVVKKYTAFDSGCELNRLSFNEETDAKCYCKIVGHGKDINLVYIFIPVDQKLCQ